MVTTTFTCNSLTLRHLLSFFCRLFQGRKGDLTDAFVSQIAAYFGIAKDSIFLFGSGRMGLFVFLRSLCTSPEDEVIVAGYTCVVVTNAIKYAGMKAKYVDISETTTNLDTNKLQEHISPKVKAIIVSHNFGIAYDDIVTIRKMYPRLVIIEDAAHALGSQYSDGTKVGLKGDASFFSFEYSKPITTGLGGLLIVNNEALMPAVSQAYEETGSLPVSHVLRIVLSLTVHALTSYRYLAFLKGAIFRGLGLLRLAALTSREEIAGGFPPHYPVRLSPLLAYLGFLQLKDIESINARKKTIAELYHSALSRIPEITTVYDSRYIYARYPIIFKADIGQQAIKRIKSRISAKTGIEVGEWFNDVVHPRGSFRYCYSEGGCPVGESVSKRIINFPVGVHVSLNAAKLSMIRKIISDELQRHHMQPANQ